MPLARGSLRHIWQGCLLDCSPYVALAEPLVDVELSWHYTTGVFTYGNGMGIHHRRVDSWPGSRPGSTDFLFFETTILALAGGDCGLKRSVGRSWRQGAIGFTFAFCFWRPRPAGGRLGEERRRRPCRSLPGPRARRPWARARLAPASAAAAALTIASAASAAPDHAFIFPPISHIFESYPKP